MAIHIFNVPLEYGSALALRAYGGAVTDQPINKRIEKSKPVEDFQSDIYM